jgi:predicted transcriptional regulator
MEISELSRKVLNYLNKQKSENGNIYGNIATQVGLKTWEEAKELCQVLYDNGLAEWKNDRVFTTEEGRLWIENYSEAQEDRIREYVYDDYEFALMRFLYELDYPLSVEDFPEVLKDEVPRYTNGSSEYDLIHMLQIEWRAYVQMDYNKYQLSSAGKKRFEHLAKTKGLSFKSSQSQFNSGFTEQEKKEMNAKIDKILDEVEKIQTGNEIIWTNMKEDLEELKGMYYLNKKNWRQLMTGKLSEMVASGIVSETISLRLASCP